jgi:hypothetical protein
MIAPDRSGAIPVIEESTVRYPLPPANLGTYAVMGDGATAASLIARAAPRAKFAAPVR